MDSLTIFRANIWLIISLLVIGICEGTKSVSLTGPSGVQPGETAVFTCTSTDSSPSFLWFDGGHLLYFGLARYNNNQKYDNFVLSVDGRTSTMTIRDSAFEDDSSFYCADSETASNTIKFAVEVKSNVTMEVSTTVVNSTVMYEATCEAIGARPEENITWYLNNMTQTIGIAETDPDVSHESLWDKRSTFTFPANAETYNQTLACHVSGHGIADFNWYKSIQLDFHDHPAPGSIKVTFTVEGSNLTVSCDLDQSKSRPTPPLTNYFIFANDELILGSTGGEHVVSVSLPESEMEFSCLAGNYLGNVTAAVTFEPLRGNLLDQITEYVDGFPIASTFSNMTGGEILSIIIVITIVTAISIIVNIAQWYTK